MSTEGTSRPGTESAANTGLSTATRSWWLRRLCSQNPFYLLSVCFVLHGTAHWFNAESGVAFSPWPLLWLTTGYTLLMAITGFVIIRYGQVWDDARSILLIILLLFVQLSLIFDETLIQDPMSGRLLLLICWAFSAVLSEFLLIGLKIRLPRLFRLPYHGLLALLFFYPLSLVSIGTRMPTEIISWRIFLFPSVAAGLMLTLIPAIRRGDRYTRQNGTPWLWPWYPWSLFVFLGVCICFRAYALCQSFDPVLTETSTSAMNFSSAFGVYFLIPFLLACGVLLLEIGVTQQRAGAVAIAMTVPLICLALSFPSLTTGGPYYAFLQTFMRSVGSPVWVTVLGVIAFYALASLRRIAGAEQLLGLMLLAGTRIDSQTIDLASLSTPQWWPFVIIALVEICLGLAHRDSRRTLISIFSAIAALHFGFGSLTAIPPIVHEALTASLLTGAVLFVGAVFRDDFAWLLRLIGAPLLVIGTLAGCALLARVQNNWPIWTGPVFVAAMTLLAFGYAQLMRMPLYRLASLLCGFTGSLGLIEMSVLYVIRESGWRGATSFVTGIGCLALATMISSWKAGWLDRVPAWLRGMLVTPEPYSG